MRVSRQHLKTILTVDISLRLRLPRSRRTLRVEPLDPRATKARSVLVCNMLPRSLAGDLSIVRAFSEIVEHEFRNTLEQARRGGCRMTSEAGRRQGGYLLPQCSFDERSVSR